ncbi:MAG: hypothetical protein QM622_00430 [Microbacterium sp.]
MKKTELEDADGTAAARSFTSPQDALDRQEEEVGKEHRIPVYELDGTTVIGEFLISGDASAVISEAPAP